jgi:hypothetical protein
VQQRSRAVAVLLVEERPRFRPALEALLKFVAEDSLDPARGGVGDGHGESKEHKPGRWVLFVAPEWARVLIHYGDGFPA